MSCITTYVEGDVVYKDGMTLVCTDGCPSGYAILKQIRFRDVEGDECSKPCDDTEWYLYHSQKAKEFPRIGTTKVDCGPTPYWNLSMIAIVYPELMKKMIANIQESMSIPNVPGSDYLHTAALGGK